MTLEGRLADPTLSLGTDPRLDPRLRAALELYGLDATAAPTTLTPASPREDLLAYFAAGEERSERMHERMVDGLPAIAGVSTQIVTIRGSDDNEITLFVARPDTLSAPAPCIVHLHGGGMILNSADDPVYHHWRAELASRGLVVIGVEFRNGAGRHGPHPFPAGLNDCASAVRWASAHLDELGASHIVVSGESGGGNLSLGVTLKANREGWVDEIAGVYAQCPFISNAWWDPPIDLPSLKANDGYWVRCEESTLLSEVYDPGGAHAQDPTCWPYVATVDDLSGLPPHVISVNELDPLRDEGISYFRRLLAAGVSAVGRLVLGTCHVGDVLFPSAVPDIFELTVSDVVSFAHSVAPSPTL